MQVTFYRKLHTIIWNNNVLGFSKDCEIVSSALGFIATKAANNILGTTAGATDMYNIVMKVNGTSTRDINCKNSHKRQPTNLNSPKISSAVKHALLYPGGVQVSVNVLKSLDPHCIFDPSAFKTNMVIIRKSEKIKNFILPDEIINYLS